MSGDTGAKNAEFRANSEKAKFKEVIRATARLWRKHHLDYNQISYVTKKTRKALEVKPLKGKAEVVQRLSREEAERIINHAYSKKGLYGLMVKTLFFTGLRVNEFVNLRVEHVNFSESEIFVERGKGSKQRYVPIFPFLRDELRIHGGDRRTGYLFESRLNDRFSKRRVQQIIRQVAREAGITRKVYPHLLRKSIATFLLNKGMPIDQVQKFLGHSKLETTQIYAQTSIQSLKDSYQRLL
jgi:integrase/recombinase XerD